MFERDENEYVPHGKLYEWGLRIAFVGLLVWIVTGPH